MSQEVFHKDYEDMVLVIEEYNKEELKEANIDDSVGTYGIRIIEYNDINVRDNEVYNSLYDSGNTFITIQDAIDEGDQILENKYFL